MTTPEQRGEFLAWEDHTTEARIPAPPMRGWTVEQLRSVCALILTEGLTWSSAADGRVTLDLLLSELFRRLAVGGERPAGPVAPPPKMKLDEIQEAGDAFLAGMEEVAQQHGWTPRQVGAVVAWMLARVVVNPALNIADERARMIFLFTEAVRYLEVMQEDD